MKPLIVGKHDSAGGAARAAARLALALREGGTDCEMLVDAKASDFPWVLGRRSFGRELKSTMRTHVGATLLRMQKPGDADPRSINLLPSRRRREIDALPHDVVNLHWTGGELLSIAELGRIAKPTVWTLHDMWAFCGAEHYAPDDADARWRQGYTRANRRPGARGADLDRSTWQRKRSAWRRPQHLVTPSRWLAECVRQSALMHDWPVEVIPNPVDLERFRPWPKELAREMMGLPAGVPLIGFGAMGGTRDPRKGWDLLRDALGMVAAAGTGAEAVIFGQSRPAATTDVPLACHYTGHLSDEIALALLYSAVDVVIVPSRQDNLPQTATEAQACGCPVVAFDIGGLPDTLDHGRTGLLARPFEAGELAGHIVTLLRDAELRTRFAVAARERATRVWETAAIVDAYRAVYRAAIEAVPPIRR